MARPKRKRGDPTRYAKYSVVKEQSGADDGLHWAGTLLVLIAYSKGRAAWQYSLER